MNKNKTDKEKEIIKILENKNFYDRVGRSLMLPDDAELLAEYLCDQVNILNRRKVKNETERKDNS